MQLLGSLGGVIYTSISTGITRTPLPILMQVIRYPNHIDSTQGHSVDYWRGYAYLGAKDYENSIRYYQKHIAYVTQEWGEDWVEPDAFLNLSIAYYENNQFDKMPTELDRALQYYQNKSADTKYYYALYKQEQGNTKKALEWVKASIEDFYLGNSKKKRICRRNQTTVGRNAP